MEKIESLLKQDEIILWQFKIKNKEILEDLKYFNYYFGYIIFFAIFIFILGIIFYLYEPQDIWIFIILEIFVPNLFIVIMIAIYLDFKRKYMKQLQLNFKNFKNYENIYIVTNKRYIQKSSFTLDMDEFAIPENVVKEKDIVYAYINEIKMVQVERYKKKSQMFDYLMYIGFNLFQEIKTDPSIDYTKWTPEYFGLILPFTEFIDFMKKLFDLIPFDEKKYRYGTKLVYYRKN